jgi:hypothetical protein
LYEPADQRRTPTLWAARAGDRCREGDKCPTMTSPRAMQHSRVTRLSHISSHASGTLLATSSSKGQADTITDGERSAERRAAKGSRCAQRRTCSQAPDGRHTECWTLPQGPEGIPTLGRLGAAGHHLATARGRHRQADDRSSLLPPGWLGGTSHRRTQATDATMTSETKLSFSRCSPASPTWSGSNSDRSPTACRIC